MRPLARVLINFGTVVAVLGLGKLHAVRASYDYTGSFRFAWSFGYIAVLCLAAYGTGLPDLVRDRRTSLTAALAASGAGAIGISLVQLVVGSALLPRFVVFGAALILVPWYTICAEMASGGRTRAEDRDRVAVVAEPPEVEALRQDLSGTPERHGQVALALNPDDAVDLSGGGQPLVARVSSAGATVVVLARSAQGDERIVEQAALLHEGGVRVRTLSLFYEEWLGKLPVAELERVALMFDIGEVHRARYGRLKRVLDLTFGAIGLIVLGLVFPVVLLGDLVANRGTVLYRQARIGKNGVPFEILKFRTMRQSEGDVVNEWTTEDDPRITPFGGFLRRAHLDELPQALNILRGELSIVGPRPEQPQYVEELVKRIPFYGLRHLVRPGLTGWAQVKYGYAGSESDALEKLQYEFFYLRHQGIALDLRIIGRTVRQVVRGRGR